MKRWIDLTVAVLVTITLLAAAGFFYFEIRRDEALTAQYRRTVEAISATRMLASQWSIEVEKVRNEVNSNFDVLADFIDRMDRPVAVIREAPKALPSLPASVKWSLNGYVQRLKAQEERIERFKSGFAIVRNSRRFIPREGAELAEAARDGGHGKVETVTRQIMAETEDFLRRPTEAQRQRMERTMRALTASAADTALRSQADTLSKHVRALLRHYGLTEQRFRDVLGSDLEDRAEQAINLLDTDHARGRPMRRYYDYGLLLALGLAVSYWGFLIMRWMGGRRRRRAGERVYEAVPQERVAPVLDDMEAALVAAGAPPGIPASAESSPDDRDGRTAEAPVQARRVRERGAGQARAKFAAGGRPGLSLAERLRARDGTRTAEREAPAREERRPPAREKDPPVGGASIPHPAAEDVQADGPAWGWREDVDDATRARQASDGPAGAGVAPVAESAVEEARAGVSPGHEAPAGAHPERDGGEEYRETEDRDRPAQGGGALAARLEALHKGIRTAHGEGPVSASAREKPGAWLGPAERRAEEERAPRGSAMPAAWDREGPAPVDGHRTFEGKASDHPPAPDAERMGGAPAQRIDAGVFTQEAGQAPASPDRPGVVHWAIREAVLERLREVEREVRAAADAAGQAERVSTGGNGEGRQEAWAAAAGRMAGVRFEVSSLLNEANRLPPAPAPGRDSEPIDLRTLLDARLDALAAEDRQRIGATLAPQAVTRGNPRALEGVVELILNHALEGARPGSGGEGHVTVTLAEEPDASSVHLTCLDHGSGSSSPGERPGLVLAAARRLAEEQDGTMEITPYPGHGTMIRLRLPLHRSRHAVAPDEHAAAARRAPEDGAGEEGWDGGAASREEPHE